MSLDDSKRKMGLMYGMPSIFLVRFKDDNCSHNYISFFTLDEHILPNRVIEEHHNHEGFDMDVVKIQASSLTEMENEQIIK